MHYTFLNIEFISNLERSSIIWFYVTKLRVHHTALIKNYVNLIFLFAGLSLHLFFVFYLGVVMNETGFNKQFLLWFYYNKSNILKLELELDFST